MNIELLRAQNLRCFERVEFSPGPGRNWLVGPNGAGKTTLLEAAYILSHGHSFRTGGRGAPRRDGASDYLVYAEMMSANGRRTRLGMTRTDAGWDAHMDGVGLPNLAPLFEACPVVYFGPDSQTLILGPGEERRWFLDWAVFHVEHASLAVWKAWRRALRQRNALLRQTGTLSGIESWEHDLGRVASQIHALRERCIASLKPYLIDTATMLVPELGVARIDYRPGWDIEVGLAKQLAATRERDRERGFTWHGAHRADWALGFTQVAQREYLSRGQAKAAALACMLALARWLKDQTGEYPLLCLDDLAAELDTIHATRVLDWLGKTAIQSWLTYTKAPADVPTATRVFHVEHTGCKRIAAP